MSKSAELAQAARGVGALAESLPEESRPDVVTAWSDLLEELDGRGDRAAKAIIQRWIQAMEFRLASALATAPHACRNSTFPS